MTPMLLALLPLLFPASTLPTFPQEAAVTAKEIYQGPHCSFPLPDEITTREYGTGWGVVSEAYSTRTDYANQQPILRVTSVLSNEQADVLAGQLLELDRQDVAQHNWEMATTSEPVTRMIAGAERSGTRFAMSRTAGVPSAANYTLYGWSHDGSINFVRTVTASTDHHALVDQIIDGLTITGIQKTSERKVGPEDYGFLIPANWQGAMQELQQNYRLCNLAFPSGSVEALISPRNGMVDFERDRLKALNDSTSRLISMSLGKQGKYLGKRRAWLNVEGGLVQGRIHQWQDLAGAETQIANFAFKPEGVDRLVQLQLMPNPSNGGELLSEVTRTTRLSMYREGSLNLPNPSLGLSGISIRLPQGMQNISLAGDVFAGGAGAVLGKADDGGPRWFFWSLPESVDPAQLPELQAAWLQKWLDRDFPGCEILKQQTMNVELPLTGSYQGLAWTVRHTQVNNADSRDWMLSLTRDWMCVVVAIPFGERTLLGILQVDDRDKFPMIDDFRHTLSQSLTASNLHAKTSGFDLELPADGPWTLLHQSGEVEEEFTFLHRFGKVRAVLRHFSEQEMDEEKPSPWASNSWAGGQQTKIKNRGGDIGNVENYGLCRVGKYTSFFDFFQYIDADKQSRSTKVAAWLSGDAQVVWSIEGSSYDGSFERAAELLKPNGGPNVDFHSSALHFAGLKLPNPDGFSWQGRGGFQNREWVLTHHAVPFDPLALTLMPDPGAMMNDEQLLRSLLPRAPEWNPIGSLSTVETHATLFGKKLKGLRRVGLAMEGGMRVQGVYVDRHQGTLRVLRFDGPQVIYKAAFPVLQDLFAAIQGEAKDYVMDCEPPAGEGVTSQEVGPFTLALPKGFTQAKDSEEINGWKWTDDLGAQIISVIPYGATENVLQTMTELVKHAQENKRAAEFGKEPPTEAHSFLAVVDGKVCPGAAIDLNGVALSLVTLTHQNQYFIVMYHGWNEQSARNAMRNALSTVKLRSK